MKLALSVALSVLLSSTTLPVSTASSDIAPQSVAGSNAARNADAAGTLMLQHLADVQKLQDAARNADSLQGDVKKLQDDVGQILEFLKHGNEQISLDAAEENTVPWTGCGYVTLYQKTDVDLLTWILQSMKFWGNCYVLQWFLLTDFAMWASVFLVLQFHVRWRYSRAIKDHCTRKQWRSWWYRPSTRPRKFGVDVIILNLWFNPNYLYGSKHRECFNYSLLLILFESYFVYYASVWLSRQHYKCQRPATVARQPTVQEIHDGRGSAHEELDGYMLQTHELLDPTDDTEERGYVVNNTAAGSMYEDLTIPFRRVLLLFGVQVLLLVVFVESISRGGDGKNLVKAGSLSGMSAIDVWYWLGAVGLQMLSGDAELGKDFNWKYWAKLVDEHQVPCLRYIRRTCLDEPVKSLHEFGKTQTTTVFGRSVTFGRLWLLRAVMDFLVNGVGRLIIMNSFPIMLCVEGPLDFVKDCTAVMFITQLDDLEDGKAFTEMAIKLKLRQYFDRTREQPLLEENPQTKLDPHEQEYFIANQDEKFDRIRSYCRATEHPETWRQLTAEPPAAP